MAINVLKANTNPHNLPSEYQEVEWIKSKDNAYINPNVNITADIGFEVTANIPTGTNGALLGNYLPGNYFFFVYAYTNNTTTFFPSKNASTVSMTVARNTKTTFSFKNGVLDDGTTQTTVSTYATAEIGQPIYLFAGIPNNWFTSYTLYECKIYNGSAVVKDLIPCYRKADGEIGLYDIITENFYSNANSVGSFKKGNNAISYATQKMKLNLLSDGVRLPAEYEEVEYLQSSGTQYIDTGFAPSSTSKLIIDYQFLEVPSSGSIQIGSGGTDNTNRNRASYGITTDYRIYLGNGNQQILTNITRAEQTSRHTIVWDMTLQKMSLDSTEYTGFQTFNTTGRSFYIFGRNQADDTSKYLHSGRFYSFKVYDNNTLVRDFVPCYRKSDSVAGLYDMQNNQFYTNAGTGTFTIGNDIPKYKIQPVKMNILKETDNLFDEIAAYTKTGFTISNGEISTNYNYARHSFSQYGSNEFSLTESTTYYVSYKIKISCSNSSGNKSVWISFKNVGTGQNYAVTGYSVANFDEWTSISFNRTLPAGTYQVSLGAYGGPASETYTSTIKDIMFDTKQITAYEPYGYEIIKI